MAGGYPQSAETTVVDCVDIRTQIGQRGDTIQLIAPGDSQQRRVAEVIPDIRIGPIGYDRLDHFHLAGHGRPVQGAFTLIGKNIRVHAGLDDQIKEFGISQTCGIMGHCNSAASRQVQAPSGGHQLLDDLQIPRRSRETHRPGTVVVLEIDVRSVRQQEGHHLGLVSQGRHMQRRTAVAVPAIDRSALLQQQPGHLDVPRDGRTVQRQIKRLVLVLGIHQSRILRQQFLDADQVAVTGRLMNFSAQRRPSSAQTDNDQQQQKFVKKWSKLVNSISFNKIHTYANSIKDVSGNII